MGRVEQLEVSQLRAHASGFVVPGDAHVVVQLHRAIHLPLPIDPAEFAGVGLEVRLHGHAGGDFLHHPAAQFVAHLAGGHEHLPGLDIAVGGRQLGEFEDCLEGFFRHRLIQEAAH